MSHVTARIRAGFRKLPRLFCLIVGSILVSTTLPEPSWARAGRPPAAAERIAAAPWRAACRARIYGSIWNSTGWTPIQTPGKNRPLLNS